MTRLNINDGPGPRTAQEVEREVFAGGRNGSGWRKHVTVDRALLLVVLLFNAGTFWERQQNTNATIAARVGVVEVRLAAAEGTALSDRARDDATYVRRDVLEAVLKSIDQRLTNIELAMRIGRQP